MILGQKVVVVMPAYNAAKTLEQTLNEVNREIVDEIILVDDASRDTTSALAKKLGLKTFVHARNLGYGGNQKTCYQEALRLGADIVIMLHPDYQYTPKLIPAMAHLLATGIYDCVIASRILGGAAIEGGMPLYKYVFNRCLTAAQNLLIGQKLSEYHTGYRGFTRRVLERLPLGECDDDFVFDNEMLAMTHFFGFKIGEVSCPTKYFDEASSINFSRSVKYGLGVLRVSLEFRLARWHLLRSRIFNRAGKTVLQIESRARQV